MSYGTSLNDAYSLISENKETYEDNNNAMAQIAQTSSRDAPPKYYQSEPQQQQQQQQQQPLQSPLVYTSTMLPTPVPPTPVPKQQQQQPVKPAQPVYRSPSYFDQLGAKRKEMIKVIGYALMILFALTLYTGIDFLIKDVIEKNDLSFKQELGLRLSYPLLVLFVLWNFKIIG